MKKCLCYSVILFFLLGSSCKKDKPTVGEPKGDYFTCYVNGVYWEAYSDASDPQATPAIYVQRNSNDGRTNLQIHKKKQEILQDIKIFVDSLFSIDEYQMLILGDNQTGYFDYNLSACQKYYHDSMNPGTFNLIEHNTQTHFMRGTFSMALRNPNCADSILNITDGKFSFHYY